MIAHVWCLSVWTSFPPCWISPGRRFRRHFRYHEQPSSKLGPVFQTTGLSQFYQWFVWRYLFNIGEVDFAFVIAERVLELWEHEVQESWCCFEHFPIESRRGAGWHHFGGLSAPVLSWYAALHTRGKLTTGYNGWVLSFFMNETSLEAELIFDGQDEDRPMAWLVWPGDTLPEVRWTGKHPVDVRRRVAVLIFLFGGGTDRGILRVETDKI